MSKMMVLMFALVPSVTCAAAAFYLAANRIEGWGWFLVVAALTAGVSLKGSC